MTGTRSLVREYFEHLEVKEEGVWYPTSYSWALGELLGFLDLPGKSVLDAGCGAGNLALLAAERGAVVSASDVSARALEATGRHAKALKLRVGTQLSNGLRYWLEQQAKFDVIVCNPPSFDLLDGLQGPHSDPFLNSYLLEEVLSDYPKVLNRHGCLLSAVSGERNIKYISSRIGTNHTIQPFSLCKRISVGSSSLLDIDRLTKIGLLGRDADGLYWNAYYFVVFHF